MFSFTKNNCRSGSKRNSNVFAMCGLIWTIKKKRNIFEFLIVYLLFLLRNENFIIITTFQNITSIIIFKILFKNSRLSFRLCQLQLKTRKMSNSADPTLKRALSIILADVQGILDLIHCFLSS